MFTMRSLFMGFFLTIALAVSAAAAPVNLVGYNVVTGNQTITFEGFTGGVTPGINYDGIIDATTASFGERFLGQELWYMGDFDVLTGEPVSSLSLVAGDAGQNLNIYTYKTSNILNGVGSQGYPDYDAIGEGSFAVLFAQDQSQLGFQLVGGNGGSATIDFFRRDGSIIYEITLSSLSESYYGFSREGGLIDVAGISIFNDDRSGIGFDNLKFEGTAVPLPTAFILFGSGLLGLIGVRRKK